MAGPFDRQRLRNQIDGMVERDAQPQVVVLAHGKRLVKTADSFKEFSRHRHGRRAYQAKFEARAKDVARRLAMPRPGIHPNAVSDPDLFRLADPPSRFSSHEAHLDFELAPLPQVVGV